MHIQNLIFYIYEKQHIVHVNLLKQINHITIYSLILLFVGGILTSLSPCMTTCIPIIMSYMPKQQKVKYSNMIFVLGIITSIFTVGISLILIKKNTIHIKNTSFLTTLLYLIIGLNILEIVKINFPLQSIPFNYIQKYNDLLIIYVFGISIGLNISPCSTPILASLMIWVTNTKHILIGISFLGIYTLGYLSPILLYLFSIPHFNKIKISYTAWKLLSPLTGGLIIATSTFSLCTLIFA